jgi:hypothetical protein
VLRTHHVPPLVSRILTPVTVCVKKLKRAALRRFSRYRDVPTTHQRPVNAFGRISVSWPAYRAPLGRRAYRSWRLERWTGLRSSSALSAPIEADTEAGGRHAYIDCDDNVVMSVRRSRSASSYPRRARSGLGGSDRPASVVCSTSGPSDAAGT